MPKLKLNMDALRVDSFNLAAPVELFVTKPTIDTDTGNCGCPTVSSDWC